MTTAGLIALTLLASFAQLGDEAPSSSQMSDPVIPNAVLKVADGIKLAAKEPGVLVHLAVKEGSVIQSGQKLGQIDDSEPQLQKEAATYQMNAAVKRWRDDIEIRFAQAQSAVSKADYEQLEEANRMAKGAVTAVDVRRAKLDWNRADLAIEKARHEQELAKFEAYTKKTESAAADLAIKRRVISAPFDGVVERLFRKQDEWVNPGDPILQLLRLDVMEVEAAVEQQSYDPHELQGCEVTVDVQLARGRKESIKGRITKVSALVSADGKYNVRAEIANHQEHGTWVLRDGLWATMTIHLGTGSSAAPGVTRAP